MQQIADWLKTLGMSEYAQRFADNGIDLSVLPDLTDQDLEKLGVLLGHRRKLLRAMVSNSPRTSGANGNPIPLWRSLGRNESRLRASGKIGHDRACP